MFVASSIACGLLYLDDLFQLVDYNGQMSNGVHLYICNAKFDIAPLSFPRILELSTGDFFAVLDLELCLSDNYFFWIFEFHIKHINNKLVVSIFSGVSSTEAVTMVIYLVI